MSLKIIDVVEFLVRKGPGRTQAQLAKAIFGADGYQQRVNVECDMLTRAGKIEQRGAGVPSNPYTYYPPGHVD